MPSPWLSAATPATPSSRKGSRGTFRAAAADQLLGTGDGATTMFQLVKRYQSGPSAYVRPITKPVAGSVLVAVGGVATTAFALDDAAGTVTFETAPAPGAAVTAGFLFDLPARFDTDQLAINLAAFRAGDIPSIPIVEVLA